MKASKKAKNVLFLARLFYPHVGGVEKHVYKISKELQKENYKITVLCEQHDKKLPHKELLDGINIERIPVGKSERFKKFEIWLWIFKNVLFIRGFDIVHVHDVFFWLYPLLPFLNRKKIFITFHGYENFPVKLKDKLIRKIADIYCRKNICIGNFIEKWYGIKPNIVSYGGADLVKFFNGKERNMEELLFFGRLDKHNGIKEYYNSFLKLKRENRKFNFTVIGEGDYSRMLKGAKVINFKSNLSKYLRKSRFILVSGYLSMLEAMVQKRVVIATFNNSLKRDYLLDSPFSEYVDICESSEEISEKINYYYNNPQVEKDRIEKANKWASNQTWKKVSKCYQKLWS